MTTACPSMSRCPRRRSTGRIRDGAQGHPDRGACRRRGPDASVGAGPDGSPRDLVRVAAPGSAAANPAFDVTPARLVTGFITERGVCAASATGLATPSSLIWRTRRHDERGRSCGRRSSRSRRRSTGRGVLPVGVQSMSRPASARASDSRPSGPALCADQAAGRPGFISRWTVRGAGRGATSRPRNSPFHVEIYKARPGCEAIDPRAAYRPCAGILDAAQHPDLPLHDRALRRADVLRRTTPPSARRARGHCSEGAALGTSAVLLASNHGVIALGPDAAPTRIPSSPRSRNLAGQYSISSPRGLSPSSSTSRRAGARSARSLPVAAGWG